MNDTLNKIKQFETNLKKCIISVYGKYLTEEKKALINSKTYTTEDLLENNNSDAAIRGIITRRIFDDLINLECDRQYEMQPGVIVAVPYGKSLEVAMVEYYTQNLAEKFHFDITKVEDLNLEDAKKLDTVLGEAFDNHVFNDDAINLLNAANLVDIINKYDQEVINNYLANLQKAAESTTPEEKNEVIQEIVPEGVENVESVYINGDENIKYTDESDHVHLTNVEGMEQTQDYIKDTVAASLPDQTVNPQELYNGINDYADETTLTPTNDIDLPELNNEQVNMLDFIQTNPELQKEQNNDIVTHSDDETVHVMESTNDVVTTEDHQNYVDSQIIPDGQYTPNEQAQDIIDISSDEITKEEFDQLDKKFRDGEDLSLEELEALKHAIPMYGQDALDDNLEAPLTNIVGEIPLDVPEVVSIGTPQPDIVPIEDDGQVQVSSEKPIVLQPVGPVGFTTNNIVLYVVLLVLFIVTTIAIFLLK